MEATLLLAADYANETRNGKLNVMGIFTDINAPTFPALHPQMYLITQLSANPAEYGRAFKFAIKLIDEDATTEVLHLTLDAEVPSREDGQRVQLNFIVQLPNLLFQKPGIYQFSVLVDNDEKAVLPIDVKQVSAP